MKSVVAINGVKASSYAGVRIQARVQPSRAARMAVVQCVAESEAERLRLNNLSPQEGARRKKTRKGRGYGAGQGGTAGYGMRGQKSRSGSGIRPGFEGGQTPLYVILTVWGPPWASIWLLLSYFMATSPLLMSSRS